MKMEVLALAICVVVIAAYEPQDLGHVEAFIVHSTNHFARKYRPLYHLSTPFGWLNDPAAFVYFKEKYHLFYQYYPYEGTWGSLHWGHAVTHNFVDWTHYPPALLPREPYDRHGCLAGSVLLYDNYMALFYTGEVLVANVTRQTQNVAISSDGILFQKYLYNPVVRVSPIGASDFRNPKVWRGPKSWYMMAGASVHGRGQLVLYTSPDMYRWTYNRTVAESAGDFGHMWESPEIFEIDGLSALILSVRGVQADGFRFRNLYQTGYVLGHFRYKLAQFDDLEVSTATFTELDNGHDFYAAKTLHAADGRRLLIAWLGMWKSEFLETDEGWAGSMTLVRELRLSKHGRLLTPPVREALELRAELLEDAWYNPGEAFYADVRAFELVVNATSVAYDVALSLEWGAQRRYTISYSADSHYISVDRGGTDGERRADWAPATTDSLYWRIFVDRSSVEVFVGDGEVVFSSRVYPRHAIAVRIGGEVQLHVVQYRLRRSVSFDLQLKHYLTDQLMAKNGIQ